MTFRNVFKDPSKKGSDKRKQGTKNMRTMKAMVYRGVGKIVLEEVPLPEILEPTDAIVRVTSSAICGSDLHIYRGDYSVDPGTIIGHERRGTL